MLTSTTMFYSFSVYFPLNIIPFAESRNPQRDIPIAIFGSLGITTVLYMLVSFTLVGMVPYKEIDTNAPIAQAFLRVGQVRLQL